MTYVVHQRLAFPAHTLYQAPYLTDVWSLRWIFRPTIAYEMRNASLIHIVGGGLNNLLLRSAVKETSIIGLTGTSRC